MFPLLQFLTLKKFVPRYIHDNEVSEFVVTIVGGGKKNPVRIALPMIPTANNAVAFEAVMLDWVAIYL
jgi:hypothetical protein